MNFTLRPHSHHWWPDATRQAVLACWDDAAKFVDSKWEYLYSEVIPKAQRYVADWVGGSRAPADRFWNQHARVRRALAFLLSWRTAGSNPGDAKRVP